MTSKQQSEYMRACEIAARDGLIVKSVTVGDETVYVVVRPTNMSVHIVRREPVGLVCDAACACTKFGRYCAHRAAVRVHLIAERETQAIAQIPKHMRMSDVGEGMRSGICGSCLLSMASTEIPKIQGGQLRKISRKGVGSIRLPTPLFY